MIKRKVKLYDYTIITSAESIGVTSARRIAWRELKKEAEDRGLEFRGYTLNIVAGTYAMPLDFFIKNATRVD